MDRIKNNLIYFNNNRTTRIDEAVVAAMSPYLADPSAQDDQKAKEKAKAQLCELTGCEPPEMIFTSGMTESVNLGMQGIFESCQHKGRHIITNKTEHFVVLDVCRELQKKGAEITYLDVDREGLVDPEALISAIRPDTILVSIMAANNETGVIQPIERIAEICQARQILFFSDASQFAGKMRCDVQELGADGMAFGSHKMYGPRDVGALYIKRKDATAGLRQYSQERVSQVPLPLMVGFGAAAEIFCREYWDSSAHISKLKNYFEHQLLDIEGLRINGSTRHRLYNTSNLCFPAGKNVSALLDRFDFADNIRQPSYVLKAMGLTDAEIRNSFRFSFGRYNTLDEVKLIVEQLLML